MSVRFTIEGLAELQRDLLKLPGDLAEKSAAKVTFHAAVAASRIRDGYPRRTGNLASKVKVSTKQDGVSVVASVTNTSPHAWIFENGTQVRHTDTGANRGAMPPGHVFIPIVAQERRAMYEDLVEIVKAAGLEVSGDAVA